MPSMLFSECTMRGLTLPNRIVVSPMGQYSASPEGHATEWHLMHLGHLAVSGAGLLITEATAVHPNGRISRYDLGLWSDAHAAALEPAIAFCRKYGGARLGMQLHHAGRKGSCTVAWERQRPVVPAEGGWTIYAPSALAYPGRSTPEALTVEAIASTVRDFAAAAERADRLGLDLLELHAAHGYLIHSFLSPLANRRDDEYGGGLDRRMRFMLDVFDAIRSGWPDRKPLGVRISASDWADGGWTIDDSVVLARRLRERGCDFITASSGGAVPEQKLEVHPGYQVPFAERIRREAAIPTMAVGLITEPRQAEEILASEKADLVALARGMLYDPRWPWHAAMEMGDPVFYPPQYERAHPSMRAGDFLKPARD
ncbi:MAG: NADH:flavin oxidoreductase/NADH oxidase [Alphaproteobacteria bacterium]|nr:NADH:flavin oxidoreductase/NADH oxidase [Alphaproteobacteria bacterium]